jgi:hypothetical protein
MADLTEKQSGQTVKVIGADDNGAESNYMDVSAKREARANDSVNNGAVDGVLAVNTTPSEGKVGASRRVDRKYVWMQAITVPSGANAYILWGFSNTTQSFKLFKDQLLCFPIGEGTQIWFKTPGLGTSGTVAFGEGS